MKLTFITALQNLRITEDLGSGDKIGDQLRISNNKAQKAQFLTDNFREMVGRLEYNALANASTFLYSDVVVEESADLVGILTSQMYCAQDFLMATWLEKECCANFELCFLIQSDARGFGVTSNFLTHRYLPSNRPAQETDFTREELRAVRRLHVERLGVKNQQLPIPDSPFTDDNSRIGRALKWMNDARGSLDYSIRVAKFCTALETLFSTTHAEIAHQLAERVSTFLEEDPPARLDLYQRLKKAYELRSRIVHGSTTIQGKSKSPALIAADVEHVARRVARKILKDDQLLVLFNKSNDLLNEAMLSMVLGIRKL